MQSVGIVTIEQHIQTRIVVENARSNIKNAKAYFVTIQKDVKEES
jgi:hypothetical protein